MAAENFKVGDLGSSRQLSSQTFEAFSRVGIPLYMSPEIFYGKCYDWKYDVWSLGCTYMSCVCCGVRFVRTIKKSFAL
jgi:serine/threonine protein kinase